MEESERSLGTRDFAKASFTAVISDLHLCEAEQVNPAFPLWKKYKTRQFFFDDTFADFLRHIMDMAEGEPVELVLNGDIFDFDSALSFPNDPAFEIGQLERWRGLRSEEAKSIFKIECILADHRDWVEALRGFLLRGHRVVFVIGNHDLELHWPGVQAAVLDSLRLPALFRDNIRFAEWFYISNGDTLIEHGNQHDPYCVCSDPINPYIVHYNKVEVRLPFGNIACRYMVNGMGFFNPHVDSNYIMTMPEYVRFFLKYMARAQPLILWTWFWGAFMTLVHSLRDGLRPPLRNPLRTEDRIEEIAQRANGTPRMVRELRELFASPATSNPLIVARELWLDRAFIILMGLFALFQVFVVVKQIYAISFFWMFIPILLLIPFFLFYSRSIRSNVAQYKEPQDRILAISARITQTRRVVYGHTHLIRHEIIGAIEHLNPGSWSPAFLDVECTKPLDQKAFIWIRPAEEGGREARIFHLSRQDRRSPKIKLEKTVAERKSG